MYVCTLYLLEVRVLAVCIPEEKYNVSCKRFYLQLSPSGPAGVGQDGWILPVINDSTYMYNI